MTPVLPQRNIRPQSLPKMATQITFYLRYHFLNIKADYEIVIKSTNF